MTNEGKEISARSQTDIVIDEIKKMLLSGVLSSGSRLPIEKELALQLGVSRGSLREGVRALAALGILETKQGDGTYVTSLDPQTILSPMGFLSDIGGKAQASELLAIRRVLETESAGLAAQKITSEELTLLENNLKSVEIQLESPKEIDLEAFIEADTNFHAIIAKASGNQPMAALIDSLVGRTFRARLWRAISDRGSIQKTQDEHRAILNELSKHDPDKSRMRMSIHLLGVEEFSSSAEGLRIED